MKNIAPIVLFGIVPSLFAGCSPSNAPDRSASPSGQVSASAGPQFPNEIVTAYSIGDATVGGTQSGVLSVGDKWTSTQSMGDVSLVTDISFVGRKDGKDEYDVTCTITKAGTTKSESKRVSYSNERIDVTVNEYGTVYMQPKTK